MWYTELEFEDITKKPSYSYEKEGNLIKLKFNNITKKIEYDKLELSKSSVNQNKGDTEQMKLQGITIHKNKKCNTWYTRFRKDGIQHYISDKTQQGCYDKLKKELNLIKKEKRL